jgi:hypothetical protein
MRYQILATLIAAGFVCVPTGGPARADDIYAAFAAVPKFGAKYHGYARGQTRDAARMLALRACKNPLCRVMQEYKHGECVYVYLGEHQVYWNQPNVRNVRGKEMAAYCARYDNGCKAIVSECLR